MKICDACKKKQDILEGDFSEITVDGDKFDICERCATRIRSFIRNMNKGTEDKPRNIVDEMLK